MLVQCVCVCVCVVHIYKFQATIIRIQLTRHCTYAAKALVIMLVNLTLVNYKNNQN